MKTRAGEFDDTGSSCPGTDTVGKRVKHLDPRDGPHQDQQLIERCLAGDVAAWEDLYSKCHAPLLSLIKSMLSSADTNLIDEIAARVWYALVANDGALLTRFDPTRGTRLITFMRAIARDEATRYFRTEVRRRERETIATRRKSGGAISDVPVPHFMVEEFLATLSPGDRSLYLQHILATPHQDGGIPAARPAGRKQTHRLYRKLLAFLRGEA